MVTIETSLRVFQYKILNNILYLNNRLYKLGFADNPLCSLCTKEPETIKHLFCYCIYTQKLWKSLERWLRASVVLPALTAEAAIIGKWDAEHSSSLLVNHVTLLFKRFLYINRTTSAKSNLYSLKLYSRYIEIIEKRIAKEKGSLECHFKKWNPFTLIVCSALCAIITFSMRGRGCGLTWEGGMGCGKFYDQSFMGSCAWCHSQRLKSTLFIYKWSLCFLIKGGFPVIEETTRNHTFSKEISQVILAAMVLAPNFCCKNCQRVISAMRGNPP